MAPDIHEPDKPEERIFHGLTQTDCVNHWLDLIDAPFRIPAYKKIKSDARLVQEEIEKLASGGVAL